MDYVTTTPQKLSLARCVPPPQAHLPPEPAGWLQKEAIYGDFLWRESYPVDVKKAIILEMCCQEAVVEAGDRLARTS